MPMENGGVNRDEPGQLLHAILTHFLVLKQGGEQTRDRETHCVCCEDDEERRVFCRVVSWR